MAWVCVCDGFNSGYKKMVIIFIIMFQSSNLTKFCRKVWLGKYPESLLKHLAASQTGSHDEGHVIDMMTSRCEICPDNSKN